MRHCLTLSLALGLCALAASPALAQPPGGRGGGRMGQTGPAALINNKGVQEELKLTDDQKAKLTAIRDKYKDDLDAARKDRNREKTRELMTKLSEDVTKALPDLLKEDQAKRLKQIEVQVAGFRAFDKEDVQKALALTDKQKKDYAEAKDELDKDAKDLMDNAGQDRQKRQEAFQKVQTLSKDAMEKFTATFSDDEKKAYKDLTGDKFDYKPDFGGRNRGGQPPRPNTDK
jgi:Spy/CpxP family protein refolding chaperone